MKIKTQNCVLLWISVFYDVTWKPRIVQAAKATLFILFGNCVEEIAKSCIKTTGIRYMRDY